MLCWERNVRQESGYPTQDFGDSNYKLQFENVKFHGRKRNKVCGLTTLIIEVSDVAEDVQVFSGKFFEFRGLNSEKRKIQQGWDFYYVYFRERH